MNEESTKQNLKSLDIKQANIDKLKILFPEIVTQNKIDFDKFKRTLGEEIDTDVERYGIQWPGKTDCYNIIQQQSLGTLIPDIKNSINFDTTQNIFIEGENLEVLKLLQKAYYGSIKAIYIDPPYNTGKDMLYFDDFSDTLNNYLKFTKQLDDEGKKLSTNPETSGRFHSNWLNMMYPRLFLAHNLLSNDGIIMVSISDIEVANLKAILNEIFGENNFLAQIVWLNQEGGGSSDSKYFATKHEYILAYAKNIDDLYIKGEKAEEDSSYNYKDKHLKTRGKHKLIKLNSFSIQYSTSLDYPIKSPNGEIIHPSENGKRGCWRWSKDKYQWGLKNDFIVFKKGADGKTKVYTKQYFKVDNQDKQIERFLPPKPVIKKYSSTMASKELETLMGGKYMDYPKPVKLIKQLLNYVSFKKDDIILDFFAGAATTAHAVLELNMEDNIKKKFIMVQLPEPTDKDSATFKAGFKTISEVGIERTKKAIQSLEKNTTDKQTSSSTAISHDFGFKLFKLSASNFKVWDGSEENITKQLELHINHVKETSTKTDVLYEILLKSGYELTVPIQELKLANNVVYSIKNKALFICLEDRITKELISAVASQKPNAVVFLDSGFNNNDQLKTNAVQIMKAEYIEFRTV